MTTRWSERLRLFDVARIGLEEAAYARYVQVSDRVAYIAHVVRRVSSRCETGRLPQDYFTPADIAAYTGLSTYTVQDLCRRGHLRHVKLGRMIRIRKQWSDLFMSTHEREPLL